MDKTEKYAREALDERFLALTEKANDLQARVRGADRSDPVHAELRRVMEQIADAERELRSWDQLKTTRGEPGR
ncbi:MAG TPA: hypothetical protein VGC68_00545 [Enterovirga sp.]